ncbi:MAG: hypothetical protein N838_17700 [Thiohalocapsa sp. PB-PSB1]|jgi:hypothetical protein|nr:MAG: hypothetical protein N838_17700 [Thiohalocapsa sp. PB-PSB1]
MAQPRSAETLLDLFASETVVDLPRIQLALGGASSMTAFRYLRQALLVIPAKSEPKAW